MKKLLVLVLFLGVVSIASAQFRSVNRLAFETSAGFSMSHTDIAPSGINAGLQFGAVYSLLRSMGIAFHVNYSSLGSRQDAYGRSFKSTVVGFQADYHINIPQLLTDYPQSFPVSPYFRLGVGYDISSPTEVIIPSQYRNVYAYPPAEPLSRSYRSLTIPTAFGAYFRLNQYADINFKFNYVYADSDMLDGHEPSVIANKYNDSYTMILIGARIKSWDRRRPHVTGR